MRIFFDAAAEVEGMPLNKALLKGPDNLKTLVAILMQFRQNKIGVTVDIREMFSKIKVHETGVDQHIAFYGEMETRLSQFDIAMTSLIFGAISSPFCADYVKNLNPEEYIEQRKKASKSVSKLWRLMVMEVSTYVIFARIPVHYRAS